jgi:hypothetical protein
MSLGLVKLTSWQPNVDWNLEGTLGEQTLDRGGCTWRSGLLVFEIAGLDET